MHLQNLGEQKMKNEKILNTQNSILIGSLFEILDNKDNFDNFTILNWIKKSSLKDITFYDLVYILKPLLKRDVLSPREIYAIAPITAKSCIMAKSKIEAKDQLKSAFYSKLEENENLPAGSIKKLSDGSFIIYQDDAVVVDCQSLKLRCLVYISDEQDKKINEIKSSLYEENE